MNAAIENGTVNLALEGEVTIYTAEETKRRLLECLEQNEAVQADLSRVSEFDTAGLQVLLLARAEAVRADKNLHYTAVSPAVEEVLNLCRLNHFFDSLRPVGEQR